MISFKNISHSLLVLAVFFWVGASSAGYGTLSFKAPEAGTYKLYEIGDAIDGQVIDQNSNTRSLHELMDDKISILGFVYLNCSDVNGCPLTAFVVQQVKKEVSQIPSLKANVKLISLSFDPKRDTPELLNHHSGHMGADNRIWTLATTKNEAMLQPLLDSYNQPLQIIYDENGKETGEINHVLRVFLIDKNKKIRNIYSTAFLHKDILVNDIKTLLLENNPNVSFKKTKVKEMHHHHGMHHKH